jgi:STE24 endopeptidase
MDLLHNQLVAIQNRLAFVQEESIDWRNYVLFFSWGICLFESYLLYVLVVRFFFSVDPCD